MNMNRIFLIILSLAVPFLACAQLEGLFVESYYVADANDASFDSDTPIEEGSVTYRVFLKLAPGSSLLEIFGDENHPFRVESTQAFFNHRYGVTYGYLARRADYEDTFALDTYLTLGQVAESSTKRFFGVPKPQDRDGSFVWQVYNDTDTLVNLRPNDGIDTLNLFVDDFQDYNGPSSNGNDTTIFGSHYVESVYASNSIILQCSGVHGVIRDSNYVMIAQLTTLGDISLQINAVIRTADGQDLRYVSTDTITAPNMVFLADLNYPPACGCTDPNYLEYSPDYACLIDGSCITPLVLGCTDTMACNYDTAANFNVQSLCCYPGFCQDRDLEEVCPHIKGESFDIDVFPNPAEQYATLQVISGVEGDTEIDITNYNGTSVYSDRLINPPLNYSKRIDISSWSTGVYHVRVKAINKVQHSILVKL